MSRPHVAAALVAALGDVVDDVVVRLDGGAVRRGSDTPARISRRRGGSAANVAASAASVAGTARFLGQVGDDATADLVLGDLVAAGVDVAHVRREGRTGTIVVLVDADGERSFLTDPGSARSLRDPDPRWLDGVDVLHVPVYSLVDEPIATTAATLVGWARGRGIDVSIDASSASVLEVLGTERARAMIVGLAPTFVFANEDEAAALALDGPLGDAVTVVKRGPAPATVYVPGAVPVDVAGELVGHVHDTTAAGDAFAAGFLTDPRRREDPASAVRSGHAAAAALLRSRPT